MSEEPKLGDNTFGSVLESGKNETTSSGEMGGTEQLSETQTEQEVEGEGESEPKTLAGILQRAGTAPLVTSPQNDARDDARNLSLLNDMESQVTRLLDLVTQKGVPHAVQVARKLKNYYLLDRMHDELVDKFYQGLVERGVIPKE